MKTGAVASAVGINAPTPHGHRRWIAVGVVVFVFYLGTFDFRPTTDAHLNYLQTRALVLHGDLDLARYGDQPGYVIERGPKRYSPYGAGISVITFPILAPLIRFGGSEALAHVLVPSIFAAAAAAVMLSLLRRLFSPAHALIGTLVFAFGTTLWPIGTTALWLHAPAVFAVAVAFRAAVSDDPRAPWLAGFAIGMAAAVRYPLALTAVALAALYAARSVRDLGRFLLACAPPLLGIVLQGLVLWGSPVKTGYSFMGRDASFSGAFAEGLYGELIAPWRGLFVYSPVFVLSVLGLATALWRARRRDDVARVCAAIGVSALTTAVLYAGYLNWWGGSEQYGYRYLLDLAPHLVLLGAYAAARARALALAGALLSAVSIFVITLGSQKSRIGWDPVMFPDGLADSPIANAWGAFVRAPGGVLLRLSAIVVVGIVLHRVTTDEVEKARR